MRPEPALDHATGFAVSPNAQCLATDPHGRLAVSDLAGRHLRTLTPTRYRIQRVFWGTRGRSCIRTSLGLGEPAPSPDWSDPNRCTF